jgi:hypothetical protein
MCSVKIRLLAFVLLAPLALPRADAQEVNVTLSPYNALGDNTTDDTVPFCKAIAQVNTNTNNGSPSYLYIPVGSYVIKGDGTDPTCAPQGGLPQFAGNGGIAGDGPHKSYVVVGPTYPGDLFAWQNAWQGASRAYANYTFNPAIDDAGVFVRDLTVGGTSASGTTNVSNAFMFYDRNDDVLMQNVNVVSLNGRCLGIGMPKNPSGPGASMRGIEVL